MRDQYGVLTHSMVPSTKERRVLEKRPATGEWKGHTIKLIDEAKQSKLNSVMLRDQNTVAKKTTDRDVVDTGNVVREELKKKVGMTAKIRARLEKQALASRKELVALIKARTRTKDKLDEQRRPLKVTMERSAVRQAKPEAELVNDAVERTLQHERTELQSSVHQLTGLVDASTELVAQLEQSLKMLESDLFDKSEALRLDRACLEVTASPSVGDYKQCTTSKSGRYPDTWKRGTHQILTEAADLEQRSMRMRKIINKVIAALGQSNLQAYSAVTDALRHKVKQTKGLHAQLLANLEAVQKEIDELSRHREQIQTTLDAKRGPLSVVQQRLELRRQRPNREAVRDSAEEALEAELIKLKMTMDTLTSKVERIDVERHRLGKLRQQLELDISNKASALQQDKRALAIDLSCIRSTPSLRPESLHSSANTARTSNTTSLPSIGKTYARTPR